MQLARFRIHLAFLNPLLREWPQIAGGLLLAHPLPVQVAAIRVAELIAGFGGEALHALSWLGELRPEQGPQLLLLGSRPSLDLLLQFRAQGLNGWYLPCADETGVEVIEELNACARQL